MAALQSSSVVGFDGCVSQSSPLLRDANVQNLRSAGQCHFAGSARLSGVERYQPSSLVRAESRRSLTVRAEEENFLQSFGNQFLKIGGKRPQTLSGGEEKSPSQRGTQFFRLGGKKKAEEEEEEDEDAPEPRKFGTQFFTLGGKKKSAAADEDEASSTSLVPIEKGTLALQSLQFGRGRRVDPKTVFVAGATGQIGARIAQQLLQAGFAVRGGVPDLYVAQQLAEFATQYGVISRDEAKRLNAVEFDFKSVSSIAKAVGNAGKVVVTIGPSEDGPRAKVSTDDALRVLEAASLSKAAHFVLVSDPGKGVAVDNGPLAGITSFFSGLFNKNTEASEAEVIEQIVESGLTYTIVKVGSTDGVDDYAPELGNVIIEAEGASDPSAKVVEVTSSPFAASRPVEELIRAIPVDNRRAILEEERARVEAEERERESRAKAEAEAQAAIEEAREAAALAAQLEAEAKKLAGEEARAAAFAAQAQARAEAATASVDGLQAKAQELGGNPLRTISSRLGQTVSFKLDEQINKKGRLSSSKAPEAVSEKSNGTPGFSFPSLPSLPKSQPKQKSAAGSFQPAKAAATSGSSSKSSGFLGGLFGPQETIYVDED
ncbi:hypothetical protein R1sor_021653 [Riccia sorocarpa]|uniref:NAD(P)-binding domain-containing protein n=1 Tax=Riccia sorocarpa TaxID=122646 RepID=A0ABD3GKM7_9MARC